MCSSSRLTVAPSTNHLLTNVISGDFSYLYTLLDLLSHDLAVY